MTATEVKVQFKVFYKPSPHFEGTYNRIKVAGLHGTFDTLADAKEAVEKCRAWFQTEKVCLNPQAPRDKQEFKTTIHDNVVVWYEEFHDGAKFIPAPSKIETAK